MAYWPKYIFVAFGAVSASAQIPPQTLKLLRAPVVIGREHFQQSSAFMPWSMTRVSGMPDHFVAELRAGDIYPSDTGHGVNRAEMVGMRRFAFDQDIWWAFAFKIDKCETADVPDTLMQLQATNDPGDAPMSPILGLVMRRGGGGGCMFRVDTRYTAEHPNHSNPPSETRLPLQSISTEEWHQAVFRAVDSATSGGGRLDFWLDGQQLISLKGIDLGKPDAVGPNIHFGIYRPAANTNVRVEFQGFDACQAAGCNMRDKIDVKPGQ